MRGGFARGRLTTIMLYLALCATACATTGADPVSFATLRADLAAGDADAGLALATAIARHGVKAGAFDELDGLLTPASRPEDLALRALAAEANGTLARALDLWTRILGTPSQPHRIRRLAAQRTLALLDGAPLTARHLDVLSRASTARDEAGELAAEALEGAAIRVGDARLVRRSRQRLGVVRSYRRGRILLARNPALGLLDVPSTHGRDVREAPARSKPVLVRTPDGTVAFPEDGPGVFVAWVDVPRSRRSSTIAIVGDPSVRLFDGGRELGVNDRLGAQGPQRVRFRLPAGPARSLEVHVATRDVATSLRLSLRQRAPSDDDPDPPLEGLIGLAADLEDARFRGDFKTLAQRLGPQPESLPVILLPWAAHAMTADPHMPNAAGGSRARQLLQLALKKAPHFPLARARLARLAVSGGDVATAEALLSRGSLADLGPDVRAVVADDRQQPQRAAKLATAELERAPTSCAAAMRWLDAHWERLKLSGGERQGTKTRLPGCFRVRYRQASLLHQAWRHRSAIAHLDELANVARPGQERASVALLRAQVELARGRLQQAASAATEALVEGVQREAILEAALSAAELGGDAKAAASVKAAMLRSPQLGLARRKLLRRDKDLGLPLSDGHAIARAALTRAKKGAVAGAEVLLDEHHVSVMPDGVMVHRVHRVLLLGDETAVERMGEIPLPEDAEILTARTWKPTGDGRLQPIEPEDLDADKGAISLPALTVGAVAEVAWFWFEWPRNRGLLDDRLAPHWIAPRYAFESVRARVRRARYVLRVPPGTKVRYATTGAAPPLKKPEADLYVWEAFDRPRVALESLDPRPDRRVAGVRVSSEVSIGDMRAVYRDLLRSKVIVTETVKRFASDHGASLKVLGAMPARERLRRLHRLVLDAVQDSGDGLLGQSASYAAASRAGDRELLLLALCRAAGLNCGMALARPRQRGVRKTEPIVDPDDYIYPVVYARIGASTVWLDAGSRYTPFDYLPPLVQGVKALDLGDGKSPFVTTAVARPDVEGRRAVELTIDVAPDGTFEARGKEEVSGFFGMGWRHVLADLPKQARDKALGRLIQQSLRGATVEQLTLEHLADRDTPLVFAWRAKGRLAQGQGKSRALTLGLSPERLAAATVRGPVRKAPLLVKRSARLDVSVRITLPSGATFAQPPPKLEAVHRLVTYTRDSKVEPAANTLTVNKQLQLTVGTVTPERYPDWARVARRVDRGDVLHLPILMP